MNTCLKAAAIALVLVLSGCSYSYFEAYNGSQDVWPHDPGDFSKIVHGIPVYTGCWPSQPYEVIGRVRTDNFNGTRMAKTAHERGAAAIIITHSERHAVGTVTEHGVALAANGVAWQAPSKTKTVTEGDVEVLFIRWRSRTLDTKRL